ncbi:MAG: hypothetical protein H6983_17945 [Ectothiorhodospiraceae bacterium]|nr:hypothetical protein [Ectothiorhodospiraceae bacterium]
MINVDGTEVRSTPPSAGVGRDSLRVGDAVAFTGRDGQAQLGTVVKLNPRRAKVRVGPTVWAVPYELLSPVIEGERSGGELIPAGD